jgi:hypothetical protein
MDVFGDNVDALESVFCHLDIKTVALARRVSSTWRLVASSDSLWAAHDEQRSTPSKP